ncbi:hypothetical protein PVAP13_5NG012601 [Panicum virgatum]|uniref:Uncharacterized protein n=1 Tax=Panicum virgatum TaxID=38727 RepID=A0A8T0S6B8_PANVG|nr:hypothetical protein PVAP13_5NG012601 [Panicum virgatum]
MHIKQAYDIQNQSFLLIQDSFIWSYVKQPAHEKIGVVDSQWIVHQVIPSLGNQGKAENGQAPWEGVRARCRQEWGMFQTRVANAERAYYLEHRITPPNSTGA